MQPINNSECTTVSVPGFISVSFFNVVAFQDISMPFYMTCVPLIVCYSALHIFDFINSSLLKFVIQDLMSVLGRQTITDIFKHTFPLTLLVTCRKWLKKMNFFPPVSYMHIHEHADIMLLVCVFYLELTYFLCICKISEHLTLLSL